MHRIVTFCGNECCEPEKTWTVEKANGWYANQGFLAGSNYLPVYAINRLEMWQVETFDTVVIEKELAVAEGIGFNTLRVFLHDKLWKQDAAGFKKRINIFLRICARHKIKPMLFFSTVAGILIQHLASSVTLNRAFIIQDGCKALVSKYSAIQHSMIF